MQDHVGTLDSLHCFADFRQTQHFLPCLLVHVVGQMQQPMMTAEPLSDFRRKCICLRFHLAPEATLRRYYHHVHGG